MNNETNKTQIDDKIILIGDFLKEKRKQCGISIDGISQSTKISTKNIKLLESNELSKLPDIAYTKGYVKSYARTLGVNTKEAITILNNTYDSQNTEVKETSSPVIESDINNRREVIQPKKILIYSVALISVILLIGLFTNKNEVKEESIVKEPPKEDIIQIVEEKGIVEEEIIEEQIPENSTEEVTKTIEKKIKKEEIINKKIVAEETKEVIVKKEIEVKLSRKDKEYWIKKDFSKVVMPLYLNDESMTKDQINKLLPSKIISQNKNNIENVFINAINEKLWLTYKVDNGPIKAMLLKKNQELFLQGKIILLFLGNIGAIKLFHNNIPVVLTSKSGVKSLIFPQEQSSDYILPLFIYSESGDVITSKEYLKRFKEN